MAVTGRSRPPPRPGRGAGFPVEFECRRVGPEGPISDASFKGNSCDGSGFITLLVPGDALQMAT